jgi:hypothetical protein
MTIETTAAPGAAASTAAPENSLANASPEVANPAAESNEQPAERDPVSEHDRTVKKFERRIGNVTRARYEAEARAQQAEARAREAEERAARLEQMQRPNDQQPQGEQQPRREQTREDPREAEARITQRAEEIATVREVTRRANEIAEKGRKSYGDEFGSAVSAVQDEAGPMFQRNGLPTALGEAILDAEDPAALLNHLGQNPDDAADLRGLSAAALGRRIAKLEAQLAAQPPSKPAQAHKPVASTATAPTKDPAKMSDAEWYAQRKAQKR